MKAAIAAVQDLTGGAVHRADLSLAERGCRLPRPGKLSIDLIDSVGLLAVEVPLHANSSAANRGTASSGDLHIVFNGTIDNKNDLLRELGLRPRPDTLSCAETTLLVYRRWGCDCLQRLLGAFAFILYDRRRRRLLAARDPLGVCELFHRRRGEKLYLAAQVSQLISRSEVSDSDLDEEYIADFISSQVSIGPRTPFKSIQRLCSGHFLLAERGVVSTGAYWDLEGCPATGCGEPEEHAERFRELFEDAVRACLSTDGRVWAELSGGLDSSAITCMAAEVLRTEDQRTESFSTLTLTFPETPVSDESAWAEKVLNEIDLSGHQLPCEDSFFDEAEQACRERNEPHFGILCRPMHRREAGYLHAAGVDVLLSGSRAEAVILDAMPPIHLSDYARNCSFVRLGRELRSWQRASAESFLNLLVWCCLRPLLQPRTFQFSADQKRGVQPWVDREFSRRMDLTRRARTCRAPRKFTATANQYQYEMIQRSEQMIPRGHLEWSLEIRYPFLSRPLVEFCFGSPWEVKHRPGRHKALVRSGLEGILPDVIRRRTSWASPTAAAFGAFSRRWSDLQDIAYSSVLVELGVLDRKEWERALILARHGHSDNFVALTSCIALEYWVRARVGSK